MGSSNSTPGVERLFDGTAGLIDLRPYTKTDISNDFCNVFYNMGRSGDKHIFIWYLNEYWYIGKIYREKFINAHNANEVIVTMFSGRRYIIFKDLNFYDIPIPYKDIEEFIMNTKMYFSPIIAKENRSLTYPEY